MNLPAEFYFYASLITLVILEGIALFVFRSYHQLSKENQKLNQQLTTALAEKSSNSGSTDSQAAEAVILHAREQAAQILQQAGALSEKARQDFETLILKVPQEQGEEFSRHLVRWQEGLNKAALEMSQSLKEGGEAGRQQIVTALEEAQRELTNKLAQSYTQAETEISAYKTQRIREFEQIITSLVSQVAAKVLTETLNEKDQRRLIDKALKQAKNDGLF
jgi:F0F1-type ATP synthase membrane subunit b/b'